MSWQRLVATSVVVASTVGCQAALPVATAPPVMARSQKAEADTNPGEALGRDLPVFAEGQLAAKVRASVNGVAILDDEIREAIYPYLIETLSLPEPQRALRQKEIFQNEMERLIEREVILQEAMVLLSKRQTILDKLKAAAGKEFDKQVASMKRRYQFKSDDELKAAMRAQGMSLEGMRRQMERQFMASEYMRSRIMPAVERITLEQIHEYYQEHAAEFAVADGVQWQDIFVDAARFPDRALARQFAEDIAAKARAGEDFKQLALKYDNGDSSYRNGDGFGTRRGEIKPPEAEPALFTMKDGQIGPVVQLTNGFHIVKLVKRTHAGIQPFDEKTQAAIRNKIMQQVWDREQKRIVAELKRKAAVEITTDTK